MANIHFIGRENEISYLNKISRESFFLVVKGRRRIGKTSLLRKAYSDAVYIFVWPDKSTDWILEQISKEHSIPLFKEFGSLLEYLFEKNKIVILDEFQNFLNIDKSIYGEIQKVIDQRKQEKKPFRLAIAGSSYSLMNKVFNDSASPLYGRKTHEIALENIDVDSLIDELGITLSEFIELWSVFEGVPYYYELIDTKKKSRDNIFDLVLSENSQIKEEGKTILSVEFGKDSRTYNTILTAISEGKTKLNEIASVFDNKKNEVIKYLDILRREYNLVKKITPLTENPAKSRMGRYEINDNFLAFWFYFYDKNRYYIEQKRFDELEKFFGSQFNKHVGRKFEKFIIEMIKDKKIFSELNLIQIGNQWGKCEKGTYEIDVVALNKNKILFGECKWKDNVNTLEVLNELNEKSNYVLISEKGKEVIFAIFAKSFSKKIKDFDGKKVYCFDLRDLKRALKRKRK